LLLDEERSSIKKVRYTR